MENSSIKRFIVKSEIVDLFRDDDSKRVKSTIFFTKIKLCKKTKFTKDGKNRYKIVEKGSMQNLKIKKRKIDKKLYKRAKKRLLSRELKRVLYRKKSNDSRLELREYKGELKGLRILTIKSKSKNLKETEFHPPKELTRYIRRDITDLPEFLEENLIYEDFHRDDENIYSIFRAIERGEFDKTVLKNLYYSEAIKVILYESLHTLLKEREDTVKSVEFNKKFKNSLERNISLLKRYKKIFDKDISLRVLNFLKSLHPQTVNLKNLIFIYDKIENLDYFFSQEEIESFKKLLQKSIDDALHKLKHSLQTREFDIIIDQYRLMLKERSFLTIDSKTPIKHQIENEISSYIRKLHKKIDKYEECNDLKSYKKLKNGFDTLLLLSDVFGSVADVEKKSMESAQQFVKDFKKYRALLNESLMKIEYIKRSNRKQKEKESAIEEVISNRDRALKNIQKRLIAELESFQKL
jgi:hypothetical protein